ncbi:MAG: LLM class flavin-dependent oxidoreductase [Rhodospirillaceae bacterium]|nr:LLM class flavin-dependent oxidoreductase [Rhodospirillaceae bacterium]MBT5523021.1 LLM class flavin-dependent oxidoreductase [Rhodospirillaceae bacterium]MBT5878123.1 LLM class flavin-dependent oxidoreductase [Rhodospirillaceae bacterium]MBT6589830.1 LLM class flavin-dependent oxidoreductase [Rhodospirillaceae bacterium]MBT7287982.1 LLM class flavin-dependent oxidoreductase [Rhodospirillaceae bacterium]
MSETDPRMSGKKPVGLALWGSEPVQTTVSHARAAEQAGFESIWLTDTQLICRELYVTLAACATATTRLRLATGVTMPRTRHASVTASALATLNELSDGRAMAGLSVGHSALRNIGQLPTPIAELSDYVGTVRRLLAGQTTRFESGTDGALGWLGQPARVPLHIAATGPRLTRAAAGMADGVILLRGSAPDLIESGINLIDQGLVDAGRAAGSVQITAWIYVGLDRDTERAHDQVRARVAAVLRMTEPSLFEGQNREAVARLHREYDMFAHADTIPPHAHLVPDNLISRYAVAGTPDDVHDRIAELLADPRIDRVVVSPQIGSPDHSITHEFITQFGAAVLARL